MRAVSYLFLSFISLFYSFVSVQNNWSSLLAGTNQFDSISPVSQTCLLRSITAGSAPYSSCHLVPGREVSW